MKSLYLLLGVICFTQYSVRCAQQKKNSFAYEPTWESLDARPVPDWYDDAKFGIFMHWGVYSVPSFGSEWFWINWRSGQKPYVDFMNRLYPPGYTYQSFGPEFRAEFFDADKWADILQGSGAKYVVLTSKHHEGFTLWPSKHSYSWNSVDVGPHRDIVLELAEAVRKKDDMHFGVYYSLFEWYNPLYLADQANNFETRHYVDEKMLPELVDMIQTYRPDVIWSDGDWEAKETYWRSREFLTWLFNDSPVNASVVVNDRWGSEMPCHHGGVYTCTDRYNPQTLQLHKWENCMTVDKESWGYRRDAPLSDYLTVKELIKELVTTVSCGGNLLMNVGPTKEGTIAPIFQDRLQGMGQWLQVNGEAIYKTKPWLKQNDTINGNVWYTASKEQYLSHLKKEKNELDAVTNIFAIVLEWPINRVLHVKDLANQLSADESKVYLLGNEDTPLKWSQSDDGVDISFPEMDEVKSQWAWSLKITNVNS